jgi:hypothetical protein
MIWRCRRSPLVLGRPPMPGCTLVLRFGWIYEGSELVCLDYIARVQVILSDLSFAGSRPWVSVVDWWLRLSVSWFGCG